MKYIIAVVEGVRFDVAPKYTGKAQVFEYGSFKLLVWKGGDYNNREYEEVYDEVAAYVSRVNAEFKSNRYYNGWVYAEMLTPKEQGQYNDIYCNVFHNWLVNKMLTANEIIVSKVNVCGKDFHDRIRVWDNLDEVATLARTISTEMLKSIHLPGSYIHKCYTDNQDLFLKSHPIFELGYTLTYSIQIVDKSYSSCFEK